MWEIYAHGPGMMVSGLGKIYGAASHKIPGMSYRDFMDSSTVRTKKFDYTLSKAKVIHLSHGNAEDGR